MKASRFIICLAYSGLLASTAFCEEASAERHKPLSSSEATSLSLAEAVTATAMGRSFKNAAIIVHGKLVTPRLHGTVGEALVKLHMYNSGGWIAITPRNAPQGIDHIWVKRGKNGIISDLMVGETKYGSSRLGQTRDGLQASDAWYRHRFARLAADQESEALRLESEYEKNGKANLQKAAKRLRDDAHYFRAAAEGKVAYRSRLFRLHIQPDDSISIRISTLDEHGKIMGPERIRTFRTSSKNQAVVKSMIREEVRRTIPEFSAKDVKQVTDDLVAASKGMAQSIGKQPTMPRMVASAAKSSLGGFLVAGTIDSIFQWSSKNPFDYAQFAKTAALGGVSAAAGEFASFGTSRMLLLNGSTRSFAAAMGRHMGQSGLLFSKTAGSFVGGSVAGIAFAYGGYAFGMYDAKTAHQSAAAATVGAAAGALAHTALFSAAAAWGTASTGTAIGSLSGAAATNATLAMYGGGSVTAGGGGMAAGAVAIGAGVAVVAIGVTVAVMWGFQCYDEAEDWERVKLTVDILNNHTGDFPGNPWIQGIP